MSDAATLLDSSGPEEAQLAVAPAQPDVGFLLETVVCDVHGAFLQIATLSLMTMNCARPNATTNLRACRHLMHDDSKIMLLALRYGHEIGLDGSTIDKLSRLYVDMGRAKAALAPLTSLELLSPTQRQQIHSHAQSWRGLAQAATGVVDALGALIKARLDPGYAQDFQTTRAFLAQAVEGRMNDIMAHGVLEPPKLRQRRRNPRMTLARSCNLIVGTASYPAKILDVAREGIGVNTRAALETGQSVAIALDDGRRLEATVVRRQGPVFGLKLLELLTPDDPLFAA